ncbi:hypothetical protein BGZ72_009937 [Mortierella alpina]|nr:hypothetical protein BGZ72_009937 [Mortierella alpina]
MESMEPFLNPWTDPFLEEDDAAPEALQQQPATDSTRHSTRAYTTAPTRATIFDIPNLVDLITPHLTTHDIYCCTLVNHTFHDAFQHSLYTCIYIQKEENLDMFIRDEAQAAFACHHLQVKEVSTSLAECVVHMIKETTFQSRVPQDLRVFMPFKNLTVLRYLPTAFFTEMDLKLYSTYLVSLLEASPVLQVVHFSRFAFRFNDLVLRLAKVIREKGRQLKELRMDHPEMLYAKEFCTLMWSCAAVEVLNMGYGSHPRGPITSFAETLPELRALAREALSNTGTGSGSHPADSQKAETAQFSQDTDRIEFAWKELGPGTWLIDPELEMVRELLQMCPFLERMVFPKLIEQDVITHLAPVDMAVVPEEPGWGCKDLETLLLGYSGEDTSIGIPEVLWRQIGQLSKLKDLRLHRYASDKGPLVKERGSVRQALCSWMALSNLRRLELRALNAFVDEALVNQVREQWEGLEWVRYKYD